MRSRLCLDHGVLSTRVSVVHLRCPLSDGTLSFGYNLVLCITRHLRIEATKANGHMSQ